MAGKFGVFGYPNGPFLSDTWINHKMTCGIGDINMMSSYWLESGRNKQCMLKMHGLNGHWVDESSVRVDST